MKSTLFFILVMFLFWIPVSGQENFGIGISNYAPANSLLLNPSSIIDSKAFIDFHLLGVSAFATNDLVYLSGESGGLVGLATSANEPEATFKGGKKRFHAYADVLVQGPTITAQIGKHAIGLYSGVRALADVRGLDSRLSTYLQEGFQYGPLIGSQTRVQDLKIDALSWAEFGLSYATIVKQEGNDLWLAGAHVKRLIGVAGGGFRLHDWFFEVADSSTMVTYNIDGSYGIREPGWSVGSGWGVDLGFTFKRTLQEITSYTPHDPQNKCRTCDYRFKIGVSLLDIGRVKFKPDYFVNDFNAGTEYEWDDFEAENPESVEEIAALINSEFELPPNESDKFKMWLPGAISVQTDWRITSGVFVNASWIQGIPWKQSLGVRRAAVLAATPRFEIKRFELAIPISMYEYTRPQVGLMLRLNSIVIGTDHIGNFLGGGDLYGADVYFHLKYTLFRNLACKKQKGASRAAKKGAGFPPCPSW